MNLQSFNLYTLGSYKRFDGAMVSLISMAIHSESGEIFAVLCDEEQTNYYVEPLNIFGQPDVEGNGPRYTLVSSWEITENFSCANGLEKGIYQHYKSKAHGGREYDVFGTVSSDSGQFVIYRPCYGTRPMMIRPLTMFIEDIDVPEYNYQVPRFFKSRNFD